MLLSAAELNLWRACPHRRIALSNAVLGSNVTLHTLSLNNASVCDEFLIQVGASCWPLDPIP